jgi:hypothetical protein
MILLYAYGTYATLLLGGVSYFYYKEYNTSKNTQEEIELTKLCTIHL